MLSLAAVRGRGVFPAGVCLAAAGSLGVGGLPVRSPVLKLICLWTLLCLLRWASGTRSWPAGGVGERMTTGATLALDVADKLWSLLSEGQPVPPLSHHSSRAPRPGPPLCPGPWDRARGRQITASGASRPCVDLGVLGDPRMRRCPPRPPSPVDSASFLVSENKEVTVITACLSGLGARCLAACAGQDLGR